MSPDLIFAHLYSTLTAHSESVFADYVKRMGVTRWIIVSDYVLNEPNRPNNTFAFSILPGDVHLEPLDSDIRCIATKDLKDVKKVSATMLKLMTDPRIFTFCFIVPPNRRIACNVETFKKMSDESISMMGKWHDADNQQELISRFKELRRKAESKSFNIRLFDNILLASTFAAFLTTLISKISRPEIVGWFSDRDSIVTAHKRIAIDMFSVNVSAFCQSKLDWRGPRTEFGVQNKEETTLWYDHMVRIPDHLAGAVSAWDIENNKLPEQPMKYRQIVNQVIADRANIQLIKLHFGTNAEADEISASRVIVSLNPITQNSD